MIRAVVVDHDAPGHLAIREVKEPVPESSTALVRVEATSLNRGEAWAARRAEPGKIFGWDFAGTVIQPAANGNGPAEGARVVGMMNRGSWAERVAVPTDSIAEIPPDVTTNQAATLPVAGLTALYSLEMFGALLGRRVLITGASGGVGHMAIQIARSMGATTVGLVRQPGHAGIAEEAGAHHTVVGDDAQPAAEYGPFDLILDSVGGNTLATALQQIAVNGLCVNFGSTEAPTTTLQLRDFFLRGGARIYGFILFHEVKTKPASDGLARLGQMVASKALLPHIDLEDSIDRIGEVAQGLIDRRFTGKAVLRF